MTGHSDTRSSFKTRWHDRRPRYWLRKDPPRAPGFRSAAEVVRFLPEAGVPRSPKPPVRIFLGTEPLQARAERVFLWSVNVNRDPSRAYEVHLMRDLEGFDRSGWTTGFTNYRFAIPSLAGAQGRAIYNDVDQIYLADPAELFDLDMSGSAALCLDEGETSVALIDCAAMAPHWRLEDARTRSRRRHFLAPLVEHGLWGPLPPEWNARDQEYAPGRSKCFHFTTLKMQPWRPFPEVLRYREHPHRGVWDGLEAQANHARFNAFSRATPSGGYRSASERDAGSGAGAIDPIWARAFEAMVGTAPSQRRLALASVSGSAVPEFPFVALEPGGSDGVALDGRLGRLPEDDVPWALDEAFAGARETVVVGERLGGAPWLSAALPTAWWRLQLELAAARAPGKSWRLMLREAGRTISFAGKSAGARFAGAA